MIRFSRRTLLSIAMSAIAERLKAFTPAKASANDKKLVLVTIGGIRRQESFSKRGAANIPHLLNDLVPQALFYPFTVNEGVTSHFNTISSILAGAWQYLDDWGGEKPRDPALFHYLRRQKDVHPSALWVVSSNKQVTANISPDANVILSKQLLIEAVERLIMGQSSRSLLERETVLAEMRDLLETDYERLGWGVASESAFRDPAVKRTLISGLTDFIHGPDAPATGDELTLLIGMEVLRKLSPAMLMMNFSDVEVAHYGSYALHLAGVRKIDSLCHKLWSFIQASPELRGRTTLAIMDEFGRDPDGSSTNGFFNHRTNTESCRMTWSLVLGPAVRKPQVVDRVIRQVDMAPSLAAWLGVTCDGARGTPLAEISGA